MKIKKVEVQQYSFETKYLDGDNKKFLKTSAPLIGNIVFVFNTLGNDLTSFICHMMNDRADDEGLIFTYKMNYYDKIDFIDRYSSWLQKIYGKEMRLHSSLIKQLKECGRLRNMVIHAEWETSDLDGYTFTKLRIGAKGIQQEYAQFSIESLKKIKKLIIDTDNLLSEYEEEYFQFR
jgi:hypothetical protein